MEDDPIKFELRSIVDRIEADLRRNVIEHLSSEAEAKGVLGDDLWQKSVDRLVQEMGFAEPKPSLQLLLRYTDLGDLPKILNANRASLPRQFASHIRNHTVDLERLPAIRNRAYHSRPLLFDDHDITRTVAHSLVTDGRQYWKTLTPLVEKWKLAKDKYTVSGLDVPASTAGCQVAHNLPEPDFVSTDLIGRIDQVDRLKDAIVHGAYPVVTVYGEGGIGKTSLVLKVAYDIVASNPPIFDFVVWSTAKARVLTVSSIQEIRDLVTTRDMLRDMSELVSPHGTDKQELDSIFQDIYRELTRSNFLIILDNLETVVDQHIRTFLSGLPLSKSKVLITSRIGVGAYEAPFVLEALASSDATYLMRKYATVRDITAVLKTPNSTLSEYCDRMGYSPGFIKWFVEAVGAGGRPEAILEKEGHLFLEFCMSNVYDKLDDDQRLLLGAMLTVSRQCNQAELSYYTDMDADQLEVALRRLLITTFVRRSTSREVAQESRYEVSDLAAEYLTKFHAVSPLHQGTLRKKSAQLAAAVERVQSIQGHDPFDVNFIQLRSASDAILAVNLRTALDLVRHQRYADANTVISRARSLAPDYFEVYRVEAWLHAHQNNLNAAVRAYVAAIDLNPQQVPLRLRYAGFLMRYNFGLDRALEQIEAAQKVDPESLDVKAEYARCELYRGNYVATREKCLDILQNTNREKKVTNRLYRIIYDLIIQSYNREIDLRKIKDKVTALDLLIQLDTFILNVPPKEVDRRMLERIKEAAGYAHMLAQNCTDPQLINEANRLATRFDERTTGVGLSVPRIRSTHTLKSFAIGDSLEGDVTNINTEKKYGFIQSTQGIRFFFHRNDLLDLTDWSCVNVGTHVYFIADREERGLRAAKVSILET